MGYATKLMTLQQTVYIRPLSRTYIKVRKVGFYSKWLLRYSISHKQTNNKLRSCARHEYREKNMELKNGNGLNSWFNAILWLNIAFSGVGLILSLINLMKGDNGFDIFTFGSTCAVCVAIAGFYWLLKAEKVGFYLLVGGCLINAIIAYIQYCNINVDDYGTMYSVARSMAFKGVWTSIGKIIFFMLLMLLKCEGKNVYQALWNKE